MKLSEEKVMVLAENAVKNVEMTMAEFDLLFGFLNDNQKSEALEILISRGIKLVEVSFHTDSLDDSCNEDLCLKAAKGDSDALNELCKKNERLVRKCAAGYLHYCRNDLEFEDLVQAGYRGLLQAIKRYDHSFSTRFSTYAVYWIKQSIRREAQECGHRVRIPVHIQEGISRLNRSFDASADAETRSKQTGMSLENVRRLIDIRDNFLTTASLDAPINDDSEKSLCDMLESFSAPSVEDAVEHRILIEKLFKHLASLTERERHVLLRRFGISGAEATLDEVGSELNITRERVRQLQDQALRKLRIRMGVYSRLSA